MKTKEDWNAWFTKFSKPLTQYQLRKLDESIEFKLAVKDGDYDEAERLAFLVTQGKNKSDRKQIKIAGELENL